MQVAGCRIQGDTGYRVVGYRAVRYRVVRYRVVRYGVVRYRVVRYGVVRFRVYTSDYSLLTTHHSLLTGIKVIVSECR